MKAVLVCALVALVAVNAASIDKLRARTSAVLQADARDACGAKGGVCGPTSACKGSVVHNLCPGAADVTCCVSAAAPAAPVAPAPVAPVAPSPSGPSLAGLIGLVPGSACAKHTFAGRGQAPTGYLEGLVVSYAKAACRPTRPDVAFISSSKVMSAEDVLSWYASEIKAGVGAYTDGISTVRALYTVMTGLGMRESSGVWCTGRDMSSGFSSADTAEAGLFQTSHGSGRFNSLFASLMTQYQKSSAGCAASTYQHNIKCSAADMKNWGSTTDPGYIWQSLTKSCPSFATEWASVLLRYSGGQKGEWGPLRTRAAEVRTECFNLYESVDKYVAANPGICDIVYA